MRIVSQDGLIDVPYGMVELHVTCIEKGVVVIGMNLLDNTRVETIMAQYSDMEQAKNVMDLLHETYAAKPMFFMQKEVTPADMAAAGEISWTQAMQEMNCNRIEYFQKPTKQFQKIMNGNIVFQFPKEDELEMQLG